MNGKVIKLTAFSLLFCLLGAANDGAAGTKTGTGDKTDSISVDSAKRDTVRIDSLRVHVYKDSVYVSVATEDTIQLQPGESVIQLKEVDIYGDQETDLEKALKASLGNSLELNAPGSMSLSDGVRKLLGRKGTKEQRKREETKKRLERLDRVKTFEEQLQEAILMQQQLGGFFRTELTKAFGPEPEPATLPIDRAYLKTANLSTVAFTECTVTDFHEGEHKGLRFSAANVELRRTVEEKSGPDNDNWMTRTETLFRGIVVRCKDICDPTLDIALNDLFQERKKDDITDPAAFRKHFAAHTADGREADDQVTPQLRGLVQKLEASSGSAKLCGLILHDGEMTLALNTRYVFAGVPEELDLRDIDGIRKWFTASLTGMGDLLDLITESPALTGAAE